MIEAKLKLVQLLMYWGDLFDPGINKIHILLLVIPTDSALSYTEVITTI